MSASSLFSSASSTASAATRVAEFRSVVPSLHAVHSRQAAWRPAAAVSAVSRHRPSVAAAVVALAAIQDPPTVSDTKAAFLKAYNRPIPTIYNSALQEILVLHHLSRYNRTYKYDPIFALGFVTVFDQLMDSYPSADDKAAIFKAYIEALNESPAQYRSDAESIEAWASQQSSGAAVLAFTEGSGEVEKDLQAIAERNATGVFHYSRFFAVGIFRILSLANAPEPATLQQLCEKLGVSQMSVNRDLDTYRGLLTKLTQAKDLLQDFLNREKAKKAERVKEEKEEAKAE